MGKSERYEAKHGFKIKKKGEEDGNSEGERPFRKKREKAEGKENGGTFLEEGVRNQA